MHARGKLFWVAALCVLPLGGGEVFLGFICGSCAFLSVSMHAAMQSIPHTLCHGCIPSRLRCARSAAVAQGRLLIGVASRLAESKKRQGKDEGRNNKAASSPIFATAGDARCVLCSRRFISKHALRIHLTRNANCRRKVHPTHPLHPPPGNSHRWRFAVHSTVDSHT